MTRINCVSMLLYFIFSANLNTNSATINVVCKDPHHGSQNIHDRTMKFVIISKNTIGAGLGNYLIYYPATYVYAALSGRSIVIQDEGHINSLCKFITCGFPLYSQVQAAFPQILSQTNLQNSRNIVAADMKSEFDGGIKVENVIVYAPDYWWKSNWWLGLNGTAECIQRITGCDLGDVSCAEAYAFAALVKGPFTSQLTPQDEGRITGIPDHIRHAILTLPHAYAPKLDMAVHIRAQLDSFERQRRLDDPLYLDEVDGWLNTTGTVLFNHLEAKIVEELTNMTLYNLTDEYAYIYVAADDEIIKDKFITRIESGHRIKVMRMETAGVVHTKNLHNLHNITGGSGLVDMAFGWYALSMAQTVLGWRKGYVDMHSTFFESAIKFGSGRKGIVLIATRRGHVHWAQLSYLI